MEKSVAQFTNRGMYQDVSISKATNEYAFENRNIRITALDEHTLFSVTNERGTATVKTKDDEEDVILTGTYLGHAILNSTIVFFTHSSSTNIDYIYKVVFEDDKAIVTELYHDDLKFDSNHLIQTLPYYESEEVQKVYWVDGLNQPRVINIKNVWRSTGETSQFDFNPTVDIIPTVSITKNYRGIGLFPAGTIQYFISYYDKFGAESALAYASPLNYIKYQNRAGSPEDIITCDFELTISNVDTSYEYFRVYSLKRTSLNGEALCSIVKDVKIESGINNYKVVDTNTNQEIIDPTKLFFIGGNLFTAGNITQKDDTLFFGNVESKTNIESSIFEDIKTALNNTIIEEDFTDINGESTKINKASLVTFTTKEINNQRVHGFYYNKNQTTENSQKVKTFKYGEIYRFAIQFQNKVGEWTDPIWIGDLQCNIAPNINIAPATQIETITVADLTSDLSILDLNTLNTIKSNFYNYRILMADATQYKTIIAQGVVCPTLFNYSERLDNKPFAISSWFMRPRGSNAVWRHMEHANIEVQGQDIKRAPVLVTETGVNIDGYPVDENFDAIALIIRAHKGHQIVAAVHNVQYKDNTTDSFNNFSLIEKIHINAGRWKTVYAELKEWYAKWGNLDDITTEDNFIRYCKSDINSFDKGTYLGNGWFEIPVCNSFILKLLPFDDTSNIKTEPVCYITQLENMTNTGKNDLAFDKKKNNYYVDNSILTFHSPDLTDNQDVIQDADLKFRIVGIAQISSSFSDADMVLNTSGLSQGAGFNKSNIINYPNISKKTETLFSKDLYQDLGWSYNANIAESGIGGYTPSNTFVDYNIYLWHKQGSIVGQNENTYQGDSGATFDKISAELKRKIFGTQRFSYNTKYLDLNKMWKPSHGVSTIQYFDSDNIEVTQISLGTDRDSITNKIYYYGNYDKLLSFTEPYEISKLKQYDPIRIKYKSTPHAVFALIDNGSKVDTLPLLSEDEESESYTDIYNTSINKPQYGWSFKEVHRMGKRCAAVLPLDVFNDEMINQKGAYIKHTLYSEWPELYTTLITNKGGKDTLLLIAEDAVDSTAITKIKYILHITKASPISGTGPANNWEPKIDIDRDYFEYNIYPAGSAGFNETLLYDLSGIVDNNPYYPYFTSSFVYITRHGTIDRSVDGIVYDTQGSIDDFSADGYSYLYVGELYRELPYTELYGGSSDLALQSLNWIPITKSDIIDNSINNAEGDTYYQRWDCLKTYPYTEEDINSVVDVTSFMVETRQNLEGRYDKNIGTTNILNIRPTNFNLVNRVYSQSNNFFTYNITDPKFNTKYKNQIVWSLQKNVLSNIDTWTDITLSNALNLNGNYGNINNLLTYNDTILAFQDKGISVINFNNRTALSTEEGLPIEIANSGKVNGYSMLSTTSGCIDKALSIITTNGLYYVDVYNSALYRFNGEGLSNISEKGMSVWFKANAKNIKRLLYDSTTQDLYIVTNNDVLLFNEKLQAFTTFVDYLGQSYKALFNVKGNSFILSSTNNIHLYKMYAGGYASNYKMVYRVNPDPLMDKVFTNIEYLSELYDGTGNNINKSPFESLEVENEYQYGKTLITNTKYPMNRRKFRIWRMDLPRDTRSKWGLDRIRSPWITLTLNGKNTGERLEFHNLNVIYYK